MSETQREFDTKCLSVKREYLAARRALVHPQLVWQILRQIAHCLFQLVHHLSIFAGVSPHAVNLGIHFHVQWRDFEPHEADLVVAMANLGSIQDPIFAQVLVIDGDGEVDVKFFKSDGHRPTETPIQGAQDRKDGPPDSFAHLVLQRRPAARYLDGSVEVELDRLHEGVSGDGRGAPRFGEIARV